MLRLVEPTLSTGNAIPIAGWLKHVATVTNFEKWSLATASIEVFPYPFIRL